MTAPYIQFKKRRELGEILSDTFAFVRSTYKQLFQALIRTSLIPFILVVLASVYYQYLSIDLLANSGTDIGLGLGGLLLASLLFYATAGATVFSFIRQYDLGQSTEVNLDLVVPEAKRKIASMIGLYLVTYVMLILGFMFFLIPGFYFLVPLALVIPLMVIRDTTVFGAVKQSFQLTSGYWWVTFGTIIVLVIVIAMMSFAFSVPALLYNIVKFILNSSEMTFAEAGRGDFIYLVLNALGTAASNLLSIVLLVALAFIYYDLDEEKNRTGLRQKIEELDR
ncbi:glycerophosphoryl diester phosphodiesterase membrane domain-containing protein [Mongoliitalea lutea]|uniref:Glycerophosphoryl diester phosphodiesterase membrane domain-containing protein n=1 Tax=Mongoliitalea lutea TaxID=849756 RepID=A0A8J3G661_9BACT|nr:glycerophosphoryl diester phosphodiesterase membrane domain-containing protein [Mongoliitalea lutea]GHB42191.1 hypothetical protein GCM10008106_24000 [Mongoliitalea lutea]